MRERREDSDVGNRDVKDPRAVRLPSVCRGCVHWLCSLHWECLAILGLAGEGWDGDSEVDGSYDWTVREGCVCGGCDSQEERLVRVVSEGCVLVVIRHQGS